MNTNWHDLIQRYISGTITDAEAQSLEEQLKSDPELRDWYLDALNLDSALEATAESAQTALSLPVPLSERALAPARHSSARWLTWRPLTAAAAGVVFGMLCTSVVFGFVGQRGLEKKTPLAVVLPGFEDVQMLLAKGFPDDSARWGGDEARVVTVENGVLPKEGKFMLRLAPAARGVPRVFQVLDLESLPSNPASEMRQIEVEASFAAADTDVPVRYLVRAFAVSETRENLDAAWFDRRDESIASATRGLDAVPGEEGWQTFGVRIQVPRDARSLVLFFGVRKPDKSLAMSPHYLDDVQVSLIEPQPLP